MNLQWKFNTEVETIFHTVVANLKCFLYSVKVSFITSLEIQTDFTMRENKPQA